MFAHLGRQNTAASGQRIDVLACARKNISPLFLYIATEIPTPSLPISSIGASHLRSQRRFIPLCRRRSRVLYTCILPTLLDTSTPSHNLFHPFNFSSPLFLPRLSPPSNQIDIYPSPKSSKSSSSRNKPCVEIAGGWKSLGRRTKSKAGQRFVLYFARCSRRGGVDSARESGKDSGRSNLIAAAYPVVGRPFNLLENGRGLL